MAGVSRQTKEWMVASIRHRMETSSNLIVTQFQRLNPEASNQLRRQLRGAQASCLVVKRQLALRALAGTPFAEAAPWIGGPTALVLGGDDPVAVSKVLSTFIKEHEAVLEMRGAIIEGQALSLASLQALAQLPARHVLYTQLVMGLNAPAQKLVGTLQALIQQFVRVMGQIQQHKQQEDESHG